MDTETNPANTQKANISTKNTSYFELGTEWNAEKAEKTPIFAKNQLTMNNFRKKMVYLQCCSKQAAD